jgi:adenosylmethionine-8-amino-7-oxononanoate aminotransferase
VLVREHVYQAFARGSRRLTLGHTWDGAPLSCAVGAAVVEVLRSERLVEHVQNRGRRLRSELAAALNDVPMAAEVRGHGYLLGVSYAEPRGRSAFLPPELGVARRVDEACLSHGLIIYSTQPTRDGYAGDQSLFAPPFTASDEELAEMVARFAASVRQVAAEVEQELADSGRASVASGDHR